MRRYLSLGLLLVLLAVPFVFVGTAKATDLACPVSVTTTSGAMAGPSGAVLGETDSCGSQSFSYQWYRDGVAISGATSSTYSTTSSDQGHGITVQVTGYSPADGGLWFQGTSTNGFLGTGSSILSDEFNGSSGSEPSSTLWTIHGQSAWSVDHMNYRASATDPPGTPLGSNIEEDGNGSLLIRATYCASSCGGDPNGSWYSGSLWSANPYSGSRVLEARVKLPCTSQTGFAALVGSENNPSWTGGTKNLETELAEWPTGGSADDVIGMGADHWFNQSSDDRQWAAGNSYPLGQGNDICGVWHTLTEVVHAYSAYWEFDGVLDTANPSPGSQGHPNYWWDNCGGPVTSLAATANSGATTITVNSAAGFVAGQSLWINTNGTAETPTISSVNSATNQITFSPALASSHTAGASTTMSSSSTAGASSISVASASDLYAGGAVTVDVGATAEESRTISTVVGTTVTFTSPLAYAHPSGASIVEYTVSGHAVHPDGTTCSSTYAYQGGVMNATTGSSNNLGYASGVSMAAAPVYLGFQVENIRSLGDPTGTATVPLYVDWVHVYNS